MNTELEKTNNDLKHKEDYKKSKLLQAFANNLKISELNLDNKFQSFEAWEYNKSNRLLYEISLEKSKRYRRYPRGSILKVDFGVNVGGEFSEQHFAITLSKKDKMYSNSIIVVPLTSKKHKNTINLGKLISDSYLKSLQEQIDKLQKEIEEIDIENCEFNPNYLKELEEIDCVLKYYKAIKNKFSYACIDQIRTISKLNIIKPINKYDIVGTYTCSNEIMSLIDKNIIKIYTGYDYKEFDKEKNI